MESAITTKGQATIPKAIREHLGLKPGGASYSVDRRSARLSMASPLVFLSFRPPRSLSARWKGSLIRRSRCWTCFSAATRHAVRMRCKAGLRIDRVPRLVALAIRRLLTHAARKQGLKAWDTFVLSEQTRRPLTAGLPALSGQDEAHVDTLRTFRLAVAFTCGIAPTHGVHVGSVQSRARLDARRPSAATWVPSVKPA